MVKKIQQLQYDENFELYDNYVVAKDQKHLLLFITPAYPPNNTGKNAEMLKLLDVNLPQSQTQTRKTIRGTLCSG